MRPVFAFIQSTDRNERNFWFGLLFLFAGLAVYFSPFLALAICGAVMIGESMITSYLAAWLNSKK